MEEFNTDKLKLLKYNNNDSHYIVHLEYETFPIKLISDFDSFCYIESVIENIGLEKFNVSICFKNKNIKTIIKEIEDTINFKETKIDIPDTFHIYQNIDKYDKTNIDYKELHKILLDSINDKNKKNNDFLLSPKQIVQIMINEIKKVNSNKEHKHFITIDKDNLYSFIVNMDCGEKVEIKLILDPYFYPITPPKIEYIKPNIKKELLYSIINLDIIKTCNWSPIINLEYLIVNLANELKLIIKNYIIKEVEQCNELDSELNKLSILIKNNINKIKINIPIPKETKSINQTTFWKSGTGYGSTLINDTWDINKYIKEKEEEKDTITICLSKINLLIKKDNIAVIDDYILETYIITQTKGLTILELNKDKKLYFEIFNIIMNISNNNTQDSIINTQNLINNICENISIIYDEIKQLLELKDDDLLKLICSVYELLLKKYKSKAQEIIISNDIKEKYCSIMKSLQFGNYEIPSYHTFVKEKTKLNQSAMMRILTEISSFKSGLPLNWESSIWVRISKTNLNIFSFIISGPKNTPYENGLFEFHACFPIDYPNTVPSVIIHTTGNGSFRFNPNLYANGKVCLSLLGTWSGDDSEKWNPKTSTFLQIMVSIQSLIFVEEPYFNEPGWEKEIGTPKGITNSKNYNEKIFPNTVKLGMINMIKNPPSGFEDVIKNHFIMKKEEILNNIKMKHKQSNIFEHKNLLETYDLELTDLINKL